METITPAAGSSPAPTPAPAAPAPTPAPAAAPAPVPATPVAAPAGPTPTARDVLAVLTPAERGQFVSGQKSFKQIMAARPPKAAPAPAATPPPVAAVPAATPAPVPEPTPAAPAEPSATAEPTPAPAADPTETPEDAKAPDRFRFKDPQDAAIALIAKTKGISLAAAVALYSADPANRATPVTPEPSAPAAPAPDPELQAYDQQLAALNAKVTKLSSDRTKARDDVDNEKADSLSDEIADARADIKLLENERKGHLRNREAVQVQTLQQQTTASRDRAIAPYPDLQAEGSLHRLALEQYVSRALGDPNRARDFDSPTWPEKLTEEFVAAHGLKKGSIAPAAPTPAPAPTPAKPATPAPTPAPTLRPKPQQVTGAKLVTSADGASPSAPAQPTEAELKLALSRMTPAQRSQVMFGGKKPTG